jgi:hypothetical protein
LPSGSAWRLTPSFPGYWGAEVDFTAVAGASIPVRLWPTARARGALDLPPGEERAGPLSVRFGPAAERPVLVGARAGGTGPEGTFDVRVTADGAFELELPAAQLDLRIHRPGYASEWLWDVPVVRGRTEDLGRIGLQRGSSLVGWVLFEEPASPELLRQVEVELQVHGVEAAERRAAARLQSLAERTRTSEHGLFRFVDVPPGGYRLVAKAPGFAPAEAFPTVLEGKEAELVAPLELKRPVEAVVYVDPPVTPEGKPWAVELRSLDPGVPSAVATQRRVIADSGGVARIEGLVPASYSLNVATERGTLHTETVTIERGMAPIEVTLDLFPVAGRVTLAGRPLALELRFGGRMGRRQITFGSDEQGEFEGMLPGSGRWPVSARLSASGNEVSLEPLVVERPPRGEVAWIELELPDTVLRGRVIDPLQGALDQVTVDADRDSAGDPAERLVTLRPDRDGHFSVRGLPEGRYRVVASQVSRRSETVEVDIAEGGDQEDLVLVLWGERRVRLRIVAGDRPVAGAAVGALPRFATPQGPMALAQGVSRPDGVVELQVPAGAVAVSAAVFPPGFAARTAWIELSDRELVEVDVPVDRSAGTLVLELPECDRTRHGGFAVRHEGLVLPPNHLLGWARMHGEQAGSCGRLVVPMVAPGKYNLCIAGQGTCDEGQLGPSSELVLDVAGEGSKVAPSS